MANEISLLSSITAVFGSLSETEKESIKGKALQDLPSAVDKNWSRFRDFCDKLIETFLSCLPQGTRKLRSVHEEPWHNSTG